MLPNNFRKAMVSSLRAIDGMKLREIVIAVWREEGFRSSNTNEFAPVRGKRVDRGKRLQELGGEGSKHIKKFVTAKNQFC